MEEGERLSSFSKLLDIPFKQHILNDLQFNENPNIPIHYFKRMGLVPLFVRDEVLTVAVNDPHNFQSADDLARMVGCKSADMVLSPLEEITSAINVLFDQSSDEAEKMVDLGVTEVSVQTVPAEVSSQVGEWEVGDHE